MKFLRNLLFFCLGGSCYVGLELLWRGRSHYTMFLAGGLCFLLLGKVSRVQPRPPLMLRGVAGAGIVTAVELLVGLLANRDFSVWDYRDQPFNLWGQICLSFSCLWIPLSLLAMALYQKLDALLPGEPSHT